MASAATPPEPRSFHERIPAGMPGATLRACIDPWVRVSIVPMPSTHVSLHYHLIFSTKNRASTITATWRPRLHAFMGGIIRELDGVAEIVGGVADHVHLLVGLKSTHRLADVVRDLKRASSEWVHTEHRLGAFAWQEGYGAFTVSPPNRDGIRQYIANQEEHHRTRTFAEEYREFLHKSGMVFDERFVD